MNKFGEFVILSSTAIFTISIILLSIFSHFDIESVVKIMKAIVPGSIVGIIVGFFIMVNEVD